jgi:hypothetical protein
MVGKHLEEQTHFNRAQEATVSATTAEHFPLGAESWTLTVKGKRKLPRFHHAAICKIMNVLMFEVEEKTISQ